MLGKGLLYIGCFMLGAGLALSLAYLQTSWLFSDNPVGQRLQSGFSNGAFLAGVWAIGVALVVVVQEETNLRRERRQVMDLRDNLTVRKVSDDEL